MEKQKTRERLLSCMIEKMKFVPSVFQRQEAPAGVASSMTSQVRERERDDKNKDKVF